MKRISLLVSVCLLTATLILSSCSQSTPEPPPGNETGATQASPPPSKTTPAPVQSLTPTVTSDDNWGLWGPVKWSEEYRTTKGASLSFIKKEDTTINGKSVIIYFISATGLPSDKVYHLWLKSLASANATEIVPETRIDSSGYIMKGESRFQLGVQAPAKGEAMEFALMTEDKTAGAFGKIIPYPIESKQGPYRMWVELRSKKGDLFVIYSEGFEPNEEVSFTSSSEGEVAKGKIKATDKGRLTTIALPAVVGKESGSATYSLLGKSGEIKVSYTWGTEATKTTTQTATPSLPATKPAPPTKPSPPTPTQARPLPSMDAVMKGMHFNDWKSFDAPDQARGLFRSPGTEQSLKNVTATGATWISLTVVFGQETVSSTTMFRDSPATATDAELRRVIDLAHSLGMRVMLFPSLILSKDPSHWWGQIGPSFTSEDQWRDWFASYTEVILHYASLAQDAGVDMFSIGRELGGVTHREKEWRQVIQEVQGKFKGPITYSSLNTAPWGFPHGEEKRIKWWDAVDYIGLSAYYVVADKKDPTVEELKNAWSSKGYIAILESLNSQFNKPVIITEVGYPSQEGYSIGQRDGAVDLQEQANLYQAALEALWGKPWLKGIFWWQWFATPTIGGPSDSGGTPYGKPAEEILKKYYLAK